MTETRLRAIIEVILDAWPNCLGIDTEDDAGYYWISARLYDPEDGPYIMKGFLSRDEIWQWSDRYAAAVVLMRMALLYSQEE